MSDLNVGAQRTFIMVNGKFYEETVDGNGQKVRKEVDPSIFTGQQNPETKTGDAPIPGLSVERSAKAAADQDIVTGLDFGSIEEGDNMRTKKEYKQMRKDLTEEYKEDFADVGGFSDKAKNKAAKDAAKNMTKNIKAADRVLSSEYYTDEAAYKAAKKANPDGRHVLLSKSDQEILRDPDWDEAFVGRERDKDGNIIKEGTLDNTRLKYIASERIGYDSELEMEERVSETANFADEVGLKNGNVTHNKARKTKNLYKHLGFDYQKDLTEVKRAAYVVATTLGGAAAGNALARTGLGQASGSGMSPGGSVVVPGEEVTVTGENISKVYHNGVLTSEMHTPVELVGKTADKVVNFGGQMVTVGTALSGAKGAALGALIGAGIGLGTMGKAVNDLTNKKNDILQGMDVLNFVRKGDVAGIKDKENQIVMADTLKMAKEKGITDEQMAAAIYGARGENSCLSKRELLALQKAVKDYEPAPTPTTPAPVPTTPAPTPTTPAPIPTTPAPIPTTPAPVPTPEPDCYNVQEKDIYSKMKVPQYRTGTYYISHAYVYEDGSKLSEADRRALQKELGKDENRIAEVRENGRRTGIQLVKEITLPSGKVVKVAENAYDRIMALPARGGGKDPKYNVQKHGTMMRAVDCKTGAAKTPWMTPEEFNKWEEQHQ